MMQQQQQTQEHVCRRRTIRSKSVDPTRGLIHTRFYRGNRLYILVEYMENDTVVFRSSTYLVSQFQSQSDAEELARLEFEHWKNNHRPTVVANSNNVNTSRVAWGWPPWEES